MDFCTYINEEKGVVVVKGADPISEYYKEFCDFYMRHSTGPDFTLFREFCNKYEHQIGKMCGKASCNFKAGEKFDSDFGVKLARERYLKVFETYRIRMYKMMYRKLNEMKECSDVRRSACFSRWFKRKDKIEEMTRLLEC